MHVPPRNVGRPSVLGAFNVASGPVDHIYSGVGLVERLDGLTLVNGVGPLVAASRHRQD